MDKLPLQIKMVLLDFVKKLDGDDSALAKKFEAMTCEQVLELVKPILLAYKLGFVTFNRTQT